MSGGIRRIVCDFSITNNIEHTYVSFYSDYLTFHVRLPNFVHNNLGNFLILIIIFMLLLVIVIESIRIVHHSVSLVTRALH